MSEPVQLQGPMHQRVPVLQQRAVCSCWSAVQRAAIDRIQDLSYRICMVPGVRPSLPEDRLGDMPEDDGSTRRDQWIAA